MPRPWDADDDAVLLGLLTQERLGSYLRACGGDVPAALRLYEWNVAASGAALSLTAMVEVLLRNALDAQLLAWSRRRGEDDWFDVAPLDGRGTQDVAAARRRAARTGGATHGHVVAELNLGFWRYLVSRRYLTSLWVPALRHAFPGGPGDARRLQREVESHVEQVHYLRNRAAHHEPIHRRALDEDLDRALLLAGWISPTARRWVAARERLGAELAARPHPGPGAGGARGPAPGPGPSPAPGSASGAARRTRVTP